MTLLGNLFLAGTTLVFLYFLSFFYGPKPPTAGDAAVGTYWGIVYLHLLLLAGLTVVALAAVGTGGFDWLAPRRATQAAGVLGGLVAILLVSGLAAILRYENGPVPFPFSIRPFVLLIPALLPLVLLLAGTVLLNESWRTQVPLPVIRVSLAVVLGIATVGLLGVLATWATAASENAARKAAGQQQDEERWKNNYLEQFTESGVDYRPAVRAPRAALDEPSEHKTIRFEAERTLDRWLRKRT